MQAKILTHRGLDPSKKNYFLESSREAFEDQLTRGFGLEFDLRPTCDGGLVIIHDDSLERISKGKDKRKIRDIATADILSMDFGGCHLTDFPTLLALIQEKQSKDMLSAIHLKHGAQQPATLDIMLEVLRGADPKQFIIFDVHPDTARYLKERNPALSLASSVAHPYDIERYGVATGGTLYSFEQILPLKHLFSWVWLDEWDLSDRNGGTKNLYTREFFDTLRASGFSIALVSPELHASSPGLLGGEAHPDAANPIALEVAIKRIVSLSPNIICTDYPDLARSFE